MKEYTISTLYIVGKEEPYVVRSNEERKAAIQAGNPIYINMFKRIIVLGRIDPESWGTLFLCECWDGSYSEINAKQVLEVVYA